MDGTYQQFLLALHAVPFNQAAPAFGNDIGLYVCRLPAVRALLTMFEIALPAGIAAACAARWAALRTSGREAWRASPRLTLGAFAGPYTNARVLLLRCGGAPDIVLVTE